MMSKAKEKIMEKMMEGLMGDFNPEQLIDLMLENPILVYAEIAFFKTDTGKLCCTVNKLPKPRTMQQLAIDKVEIGQETSVIVIPTAEPTAEAQTE